MNYIEESVYNLLKGKVNELGYTLYSVRYIKESGENYLHITLDKDGDISLDEIVHVSDLISPLLDISDVIKDKYVLDVSTLGAEKAIDPCKLEYYKDKYLNVHLSHPYKGLNNIIGTLISIDKTNATMEYKEKTRTIKVVLERKYIDKVNLAIKF